MPAGFTHIGELARMFIWDLKRRQVHMDNDTQTPPGDGKRRLPQENEARVVGRLVNAPKIKEGAGAHGDYKMARFVLAVNHGYKDASGQWVRETDFVPVVAWRALAEAVAKAGKGSALRVIGRIKTWQVEGKNYRWELKADTLEVLDRRPIGPPATGSEKEKEMAAS
jgi:single-strand DNA-binding protein